MPNAAKTTSKRSAGAYGRPCERRSLVKRCRACAGAADSLVADHPFYRAVGPNAAERLKLMEGLDNLAEQRADPGCQRHGESTPKHHADGWPQETGATGLGSDHAEERQEQERSGGDHRQQHVWR